MTVQRLTRIAMSTALMALCSWITLPAAVPFTLQTFGWLLTMGLMGGKWGSVAVAVYLLAGSVGLPVFAGMQGGFGVLLGATGGYLFGFLLAAFGMWGLERWIPTKSWVSMSVGQLLCYTAGTLWYQGFYAQGDGLWLVVSTCVLPFILTDGLKIWLASRAVKRIRA